MNFCRFTGTRMLPLFLVLALLVGCGGGGSNGSGGSDPTPEVPGNGGSNGNTSPTSYTLNGTVNGLASGTTVTLTDGTTPKTLNADGSFSFVFAPNVAYSLSVTGTTAPAGYTQTCSVTNGSGTAEGATAILPVTATVSCSTQLLPITEYSLSVTVTGLAADTELVLNNTETGYAQTLTENGTIALEFAAGNTAWQPNDLYDLSVSVTQPDFSALGKGAVAGTSVWMQSCAFAGDSAQGAAVGNNASIELTLNCGSYLYFAANGNNGAGNELWRTDGTANGTYMVADINPSGDANPDSLTVMNGKLYFAANDGTNGTELWVTDGTVNGTNMVANINATGDASPAHLIVMNDKLYFAANDGTKGNELWGSDGTEGGTEMVKDINSGASGSNPHSFVILNDKLYFSAADFYGARVWESDGAEAGTKFAVHGPTDVKNLTVLGNRLFFSGRTTANGAEPWVSNGTQAGSSMIKDINVYGQASNSSTPTAFFTFNGQTYFIANTNGFVGGYGLYRTDGTEANTQFINYVHKAAPIAFNNQLYFLKGDSNPEGWKDLVFWDGAGTTLNSLASKIHSTGARAVLGGKLYFHGNNTAGNMESLWVIGSDNTPVTLGAENYRLLGGSAEQAWFIADDGLWRTDGSTRAADSNDIVVSKMVVDLSTLD